MPQQAITLEKTGRLQAPYMFAERYRQMQYNYQQGHTERGENTKRPRNFQNLRGIVWKGWNSAAGEQKNRGQTRESIILPGNMSRGGNFSKYIYCVNINDLVKDINARVKVALNANDLVLLCTNEHILLVNYGMQKAVNMYRQRNRL